MRKFFIQSARGHRLRVGDTDDVTGIYHGNLLTGQDICWERVGFAVVAMALLTFFGFTRSFVAAELARLAIWVGLTAGVFTLLRFVVISIRLGRAKDNPDVK